MQTFELIQKILRERGWSQTALSEAIGVDRTLINNYVTGKREPGGLACVMLSALASTVAEREFWMMKSQLNASQLALLAGAIGAPSPTVQPGEEAQLLEWWRGPKNPMEASIKNVIEKLLASRTR